MTFITSTPARNASCTAVVDLLDAAASPGYIEIRTGPQPASPQDAPTGTILVTLTLSQPAFGDAGAVNPGEAIAGAIADVPAIASGTPGWARLYDGDDLAVCDVACGDLASGAEFRFDVVTWVAGGATGVNSLTITQPA